MLAQPPQLKITATLGPASESEAVIRALARVVERFRLNASHLGPEGLEGWLLRLRDLMGAEMPSRRVVIDLQGAKMRLGRWPKPVDVVGEVELVCADQSDDARALPVPHPELFASIGEGERLSADDGRVVLRIIEVPRADRVRALVEREGRLSSHKGINRPEHPLPCVGLSARDRASVDVVEAFSGLEIGYAFSFVHDGSEARHLRALSTRPLAAKIERPEAFAHLGAIADAFDELWLCRGDLGAQAGLKELGPLQDRFVAWAKEHGLVEVLLAGEVLGHMSVADEPTRSEVVLLHQLRHDVFSGIVLSDETAVGRHPMAVASALEALCGRAH